MAAGLWMRGRSWYYDFLYRGRRHTGCIGPVNKRAAEDILAKKRAEVVQNRFGISAAKEISFREFLETKYLPFYLPRHRKTSNAWTSRRCRVFADLWGDKRLQDISRHLLDDWQTERRNLGRAAATISQDLLFLQHVFNKALDWQYVQENPLHKIDRPSVKNNRVRFLSEQEEKDLMFALPDRMKTVSKIALLSGLRENELVTLTWNDIDLVRMEINVTDENSKSKSRRTIPINKELMSLLLEHKNRGRIEYTGVKKKANLIYNKSVLPEKEAPVFGKILGVYIRRLFHTAVLRAGIQDLHFHDLRHTFASRLVMAGVDIMTVKELLGHATITMTQRYSHLSDDHKRNAVERLGHGYVDIKSN